MTLFTALLTFLLGTAIGSFISVVLFRTYKNEKGILLGHSFCPSCKKKLKWSNLIPIFSWLFQKGKCGFCNKKISSHYVILELVTGLLFLTAFLHWNFLEVVPSTIDSSLLNYFIDWKIFAIFIFYIIEFSFFTAIFFYDLMYKEIPDRFSIPAIAIAIAGGLILNLVNPIEMLIGGIALFAFFALQLIISKGKWVGGGDLRLGALIGVLLGWKMGIIALVLAYFTGSIISLILLAQKKATRKSEIAFGPFLITGLLIALFYGDIILDWYLSTMII